MDYSTVACPHANYGDALKKKLLDICAGGTLPCRGEQFYYFPEGHIEKLGGPMVRELELPFELPSKILCEVMNVYHMELSEEVPYQYLDATDLQGNNWRFKHVFRGTPKRHLLTEGWKAFASSKKLAKGDVLNFLRGETGPLLVGLKKLIKQDTNGTPSVKSLKDKCVGTLSSAFMAIKFGTPFHFIYKPRENQSEFMVNVNKYLEAQNLNLPIGTRFSMRLEGEEVLEQRFTGHIVGSQDNVSSWAGSEWRSIKVQWDEPSTFLPERVSRWELELASNSQISERSELAQPNDTVDFTYDIPYQRRRTEGQFNESCSRINMVESSYGVEGNYDVDSSGANLGKVSQGNAGILQESYGLAEGSGFGNIERPTIDEFDFDISNFFGEDNSPSLLDTNFPSTEFGNLPPIPCISTSMEFRNSSPTHTSSPGVLPDERATLPSTEIGIPLTEFEISPQPPQVASTSAGDIIGTYKMQVDFHGFYVRNHLIPYLECIYLKMGEFWRDSKIRNADTVTSLLNGLGEALYLMKHRNLESLNIKELEDLMIYIVDASNAGFKLDCLQLQPIACKAKEALRALDQCNSLEKQKSSLECQLREVDSECQKAEVELQNHRQELVSLTEGLVYQFIP
ncbi:auxin response factor 2 isoform X2 [Hevea brasiliensis]|nr:auxin response factor 2 isoform X2 [Hevea brasiliensis]